MFRLLSKESNIFSIPLYIGILLFTVILINGFQIINFGISEIIFFAGAALAYFIFGKINLTYQTHLPLLLYTIFLAAFYREETDLGISISVMVNSLILLILTSTSESFRANSYILVGSLVGINYLILPVSWPLLFFVIFHIVGTSQRLGLNIFRFVFGIGLILLCYTAIALSLGYRDYDERYFPFPLGGFMRDYSAYYFLAPLIIMLIVAVANHFQYYNAKSPVSRFKYTFLLIFSLAQLVTIIFYMGRTQEFLLLLAMPASIILSRFLRFLPKNWMQESGFWAIIISLFLYRFSNFFTSS